MISSRETGAAKLPMNSNGCEMLFGDAVLEGVDDAVVEQGEGVVRL
jgi:hypothetical protein